MIIGGGCGGKRFQNGLKKEGRSRQTDLRLTSEWMAGVAVGVQLRPGIRQ